ncbi:MAG TPA: hypothetical protein DCG75_04615 [Bacteroidales bacterium]|nr:hypothetical protein [Bacteroidales bacterium]
MKKRKNAGKSRFYILVTTALFGVLTSCSPEYIPNMVNSPMLSNQGEFQATIATGTSNFDAQTAFAITDNIGIMVNGSFGDETNDSTSDFHKHAIIEGGIGYYDKIGSKGRYEIYGGYGLGKVEGFYEGATFDSQITDARFNRFFIQPGIGISTGIYDGSFSPRFSLVQMNPNGADFKSGQYNVFFEPVITSKVGFKYVKFVFQFGVSLPFGEDNLNYDYQPFIMNIGLNVNLGRKYDF